MNIRQVQESDNKLLADLIREVFVEHNAPKEGTVYSDPTTDNLYALFQNEKSMLWVAQESGEVLGCCGVYPTDGLPDDCVELVKFYLSAKARGRGIGRQLMEQSIQSALTFGYEVMYIESLPHFAKAVNMYNKLGFVMLDRPMGQSGHTTCNIWMSKKL